MNGLSKRLRIALLFEYATLWGGERSMLACLESLRDRDVPYDFVAVAPDKGRLPDALRDLGIEVITFLSQMSDQKDAELIRIVQRSGADLLHSNSLSMGRLTGRLAGQLSVPTSTHVRDILKLSNAAISDLNRNRRLIAVSHATHDYHVTQGLDPKKVVVVHNGLDLSVFQPRARTGALHRQLGLPVGCKIIAAIGQIGLRKGQDILAAAAAQIVRKIPDCHFVLIGERTSTKAESIEFENSIVNMFEKDGLGGHLHRSGYRNDLPEILPDVDLVAHAANQEPYGRVLLEAAACGVPVVATDVGGTKEIVVDGVTGRVIPPKDPQALAVAAIEILLDKYLSDQFRINARQRAVNEFGIERASDQLAAQWDELLSIGPKGRRFT